MKVSYLFVKCLENEGDISGALWEIRHQLEKREVDFDGEWYLPIRRRILESLGQLQQLQEAITSKMLSLVEIPVDAGVNNQLVQELNQYWEKHHGTSIY